MKKPVMLMILDGFGLAPASPSNAISTANTPNLDKLFAQCPTARLNASGTAVGLPKGQMGNSEVGHTNIGAGRVVWQELSKITNQIESGKFFENEDIKDAMLAAKDKGSALHLMGLLSDGGVHSHINHLLALIDMAKMLGLTEVYVHPILDGRDTPPACAEEYIEALEKHMAQAGVGKIADICGRFYAMDRDKRWERLVTAYDLYTLGEGRQAESASALLKAARDNGETDEFVLPGAVAEDGKAIGTVKAEDSLVFFNFRPDRAREITRAFVDPGFDAFERKVSTVGINYVCFTTYDATIPNVKIAFKPQSLKNTLGEYMASLGKTQLRIAETEKYAHVTFFFNGGVEAPYEGEDRILVASPKVATYDLQPEMSAYEVTDKVIEAIESGKYDMIILNYANCDMVGHTGVFDAAVKAVEAVDSCVGKVAEAMSKAGGKILLTADHGNADKMYDEEGKVVTAHSTNPVPIVLVGGEGKLTDGALCDLAPTMLTLMNIPVPEEMEGKSLLV
ncbi:MAG: 2,3-bisphosphoglycerate-independent phosphoglycerate mutase [Clostridia bacterium]|nr:2,3-bisphosphoglycerate-independent phosphoglycerate mutase [Clostridia bacterium]